MRTQRGVGWLWLTLGLIGVGCAGSGEPGLSEQGARVPQKPGIAPADVAADGPQLAPLQLKTPVYAQPDLKAEAIGTLRLGAKVARSNAAVSSAGCAGGWYSIFPSGFVCVGTDATLDLAHPLVRAINTEPDRTQAMPYHYAFVRAIAPNYLRVPSKEEQFQYEMRLERHLRSWSKLKERWDQLDVGANDVPLDERGVAEGGVPDSAHPLDMNQRYGGNGDDGVPWWLQGKRGIPNVSAFRAPPYAVIAGRVARHAGVALIGTFVSGEESMSRRFAISTDGRLIPADKLKADSGSPFHGHDIRDVGLPIGFAWGDGAAFWEERSGGLVKGQPLVPRQLVTLSGAVRNYRGERMVQTRDGRWLKSDDLRTVAKPSELPSFAKNGARFIDVSILNQTLVLWEGQTPVYATLVSTGRDGLGDPNTTLSTPQGVFSILQKHVTATMDSDVADKEFELRDVPWVMYFKGGYALHAAYWHDDFGRARSHGCINLSPIDARYVFNWSTPEVPEHWHSAFAGEILGQGTMVSVHQ
ncbi:MAG TPA: L,D-transpeptidase [Polyangiaceae bacterium]|nr:L,D-transpeptidase [Polyangiaceae bacterium]